MKNFKEEIEAMKAQIAALENNLVCADGQCGCGCDDSPVETEDEGPEFDGVGFSEADRVISGQYMNVGAETAVFTREELITFAAKLMERTVQACKEAISDTDFDADYICSHVGLIGSSNPCPFFSFSAFVNFTYASYSCFFLWYS